MPTVILHIQNEDPVVGEIEEMPQPTDRLLVVKNPRRRDGKDLHYIDASVQTVIWPISRVNFIEIFPAGEDEEIISQVRE
jgi:hypothetical protein